MKIKILLVICFALLSHLDARSQTFLDFLSNRLFRMTLKHQIWRADDLFKEVKSGDTLFIFSRRQERNFAKDEKTQFCEHENGDTRFLRFHRVKEVENSDCSFGNERLRGSKEKYAWRRIGKWTFRRSILTVEINGKIVNYKCESFSRLDIVLVALPEK